MLYEEMSNESENKKSLAERVKRIAQSNVAEHILNVFKAGLATTPFAGGVAALMSDYIPTAKQKRLEEFAEQISNDLTELQERVDETRILTDEFAFLFEKCLKGVSENYQPDKLEAFRGILLNAALGTDLTEEEEEYFLNLVNTLSTLHIRILRFMAEPTSYLKAHEIPIERIQGGFSEFFPIAIPRIELEVIKSAFSDLYQNGLINSDKSVFSTMTSSQGLNLVANRVSDLGRRFITFCTKPG